MRRIGGQGGVLGALLSISAAIDRILAVIGKTGAWMSVALMCVVVYDVITRYFGVPKPFGLNATQLQEFEYWLHTILFALMIGYAYTRQSHVRIDLIRDRLPLRVKYMVEIAGCALFLIPVCVVQLKFMTQYAMSSYQEHEISKSVIGLTNMWILKSFLPLMFLLLLLAAVSQLIKSVAGLTGDLPRDKIAGTVGGDH